MNGDALAIYGGKPVINNSAPHANRTRFTEEDHKALDAYFSKSNPVNSFFGREAELIEYEELLCRYFGRKYCLLLNSGTSALYTSYFALGLGQGDEVIVPTYTHHATVMPLVQLGCSIIFADCSADTGNIDPVQVRRLINQNTKAIVVTHQWGHPADMPLLRVLADEYDCPLVEDLSLAVGASIGGILVGSFGDASCFSLGSTKMFSGGQGGAVLFDDITYYERANLFAHFGKRCYDEVRSPIHRRYVETGWGLNLRMHVLAIVVSMARFIRREELIALRHERFNRIGKGLHGHPFMHPPKTRQNCFRGQWQGYCISVDTLNTELSIDLIYKALSAEGLQLVLGGYQRPLHVKNVFKSKRNYLYPTRVNPQGWKHYRIGDFPIAERLYNNSLGFPLFLDEPFDLIDQYIDACWKISKHSYALKCQDDGKTNGS